MNLKSYTRGIGAGLIVAALVLGVGNKTEKMTDAQVKARAAELGMIESQTLTQITGDTTAETETSTSSEETVTEGQNTPSSIENAEPEFKEPDAVTVEPIISEEENQPADDETQTSTDEKEDEQQDEDSTVEEPAENPSEPEDTPSDENGTGENPEGSVEIQIVRGDSSVTVARRMYEAGLVESAVEFDRYLCQNGYDRYISVGTYTISFGATFEEMAKIITGK